MLSFLRQLMGIASLLPPLTTGSSSKRTVDEVRSLGDQSRDPSSLLGCHSVLSDLSLVSPLL